MINNTCNHNNILGVNVTDTSNFVLKNNICSYNTEFGIYQKAWLDLSRHLCSDYSLHISNICNYNGEMGIFIESPHYIALSENTCKNNKKGILLQHCKSIELEESECKNNIFNGITLYSTNSSFLTYNVLQDNGAYGVALVANSNYNIIHHNSFIDNNIEGISQGYDSGKKNRWYDKETEEGNYWSDWKEDSPYRIDSDVIVNDPYPLNKKLERTDETFFPFVTGIVVVIFLKLRKRRRK